MKPTSAAVLLILSLSAWATSGCGSDEKQYEKKPSNSGKAVAIPNVPTLPQIKKKDGDAYTVAGVIHELRSTVHHGEVDGQKLSLVGYIVRTNLVACANKDEKDGTKEGCTPECAVHKQGKADPTDCIAPVPAFWIADVKDDKNVDVIQVMGWASNFARIFDVIELIDKTAKDKQTDKDFTAKLLDEGWNVQIPNPLPAVGAKVKVTGLYGQTFDRGTSLAADPKHGIMNAEAIEYLEPAPDLANLPTMKARKKDNK